MKNILLLTVLSLAVIACKKKNKTPETPIETPAAYNYTANPGSYWVYDWYQVDSLGNETYTNLRDTVYVEKDTVINGNTYHKFTGTELGNIAMVRYERDSSGFIVDHHGEILYSFNNVAMPLSSRMEAGVCEYATSLGVNASITTAFGTHNACVRYTEVTRTDAQPVNNCGDMSVRFNTYFVSGIGMVHRELETFNWLQSMCSKKIARLSSYYVAP